LGDRAISGQGQSRRQHCHIDRFPFQDLRRTPHSGLNGHFKPDGNESMRVVGCVEFRVRVEIVTATICAMTILWVAGATPAPPFPRRSSSSAPSPAFAAHRLGIRAHRRRRDTRHHARAGAQRRARHRPLPNRLAGKLTVQLCQLLARKRRAEVRIAFADDADHLRPQNCRIGAIARFPASARRQRSGPRCPNAFANRKT
jgi:hypothetical protein